MADERVHKKTHFAPEAGVQGPAAAAPGRPNSTSPVQENGASLKEQQQRVDVAQQQQPPGAQTLTYPDQKEFAHRRDIYSIHGEQVGTLHCCTIGPGLPLLCLLLCLWQQQQAWWWCIAALSSQPSVSTALLSYHAPTTTLNF